ARRSSALIYTRTEAFLPSQRPHIIFNLSLSLTHSHTHTLTHSHTHTHTHAHINLNTHTCTLSSLLHPSSNKFSLLSNIHTENTHTHTQTRKKTCTQPHFSCSQT